ncbi:unnamed protein product [Paramecium sonneborni]|uniref:Uncharacterized protein n=1 Tax=Paramecium sonneborni TaxID=65129 RepID=A0A8S1MJN8_9CILI|nr:unnamed protein product [Paramecium sonneborni]
MSQIIQEIIQQQKIKEHILTEVVGHTLEITFNRPEFHNAFTVGMYVMFQEYVLQADKDPNIYQILVKSNGKSFSSGNDLRNFDVWPGLNDEERKQASLGLTNMLRDFTSSFLNLTKPIIACCQGGVIGFIFPLLSIFDQVYVTEDTYFFAPMLLFGQGVEMFSSYTFPRIFGQGKTFSLLFRGQKLSAKEALHFGYAQEIFKTQDEMIKKARQICQQLEQQDQSAINHGKKLIKRAIYDQLKTSNEQELLNLERIWSGDKLVENVFNYMSRLKAKL